jgi:hypothetical protein
MSSSVIFFRKLFLIIVLVIFCTSASSFAQRAGQEGLIRMFSARHDFSNEWHRFFNPTGEAITQMLELNLTKERFPSLINNKSIELHSIHIFLKLEDGFDYDDTKPLILIVKKEIPTAANGTPAVYDPVITDLELLVSGSAMEGLPFKEYAFGSPSPGIGKWLIEVTEAAINDPTKFPVSLTKMLNIDGVVHTRLNPEAIEDIFILFRYSAS